MKYRALIVDDEWAARDILMHHLQKIELVEVIGACKNALEAFSFLSKNEVDIIFLDINMPDISGLSFAKAIQKDTKIIFTTAYREYAVDGFDLQAVDYLLKPISLERLIQSINKFKAERISSQPTKQDEFIFVRSERKMVKVNFEDILYIESLSDYLKIATIHKNIVTRETISNIETQLSNHNFLRCHRSFIVSIDRISAYTNEQIEINEQIIPISRNYKKAVLKCLANG